MSNNKLKPGRPRMEKEDSKAARQARAKKQEAWIAEYRKTHVRIATWLPLADAAALKAQARQDGVDASEVVRSALAAVLSRSSKSQAKAASAAALPTAQAEIKEPAPATPPASATELDLDLE